MRLESDRAFLELNCVQHGPVGTPGKGDVLINVTVCASTYSTTDHALVAADYLGRFVEELRGLEESRQGQAILSGASPEKLRLEFYSTDSPGHMAVRGHLGRYHQIGRDNPTGFLLQLRFAFRFEPDRLPSVLRYFESLR
jgi:hypothetical protein